MTSPAVGIITKADEPAVEHLGVSCGSGLLEAEAVEATDEVPPVSMAEGDSNVLGGHFKLVDHVPAREVAGGEVGGRLPEPAFQPPWPYRPQNSRIP